MIATFANRRITAASLAAIALVLGPTTAAAQAVLDERGLPKPPSTFDPVFYYRPGAVAPLGRRSDWIKMLVPFMREGGRLTGLILTAHTDTVGSARANLALSHRRVELLRRWFVEAGIPTSLITTHARGEMEPAVNHGDEVAEPLNRRTTINMNF